MNKRRLGIWHPTVVYLFLLAIVILVSWLGSIYEIRSVSGNSDQVVRSVLTSQGLRWMGRSAAGALTHAPFGQAIMLLLAIGAVVRSGLFQAIIRPESAKQRVALVLAACIFLAVLGLILSGLFFGNRPFLSLVGTLKGSPLAENPTFFMLLLTLFPSLVFGLSAGKLKTLTDCVNIAQDSIKAGAPFLLTLLVASQLIQTLEYTRLFRVMGLTENAFQVVSFLVYWLPLPFLLTERRK